jgi:hypothetical protein
MITEINHKVCIHSDITCIIVWVYETLPISVVSHGIPLCLRHRALEIEDKGRQLGVSTTGDEQFGRDDCSGRPQV